MGSSPKQTIASNVSIGTTFPSPGGGIKINVGNFDSITLGIDGTGSAASVLDIRLLADGQTIMRPDGGTAVADDLTHDLSTFRTPAFRIDTTGLGVIEVLLKGDASATLSSVSFSAEGTESRGPVLGG